MSPRAERIRDVAASPDDLGFARALWRGVDALRLVSLLYAIGVFATRADEYRHPVGGGAVLALMAVWTAFVWLWPRRPGQLVVADLAIACAAVLSTLLVDDRARIAAGASTLPLTWPAAAVVGWALWRGPVAGLVASLLVGVANVAVTGGVNTRLAHNIVLLLIASMVVGVAVRLFERGRTQLAEALQVAAAARERERLARDIHDSVLQVLAFVQRRGLQIGGESAELGRMAGEQEVLLRGLVTASSVAAVDGGVADASGSGEVDVAAAVRSRVGVRAEVSAPAQAVPLRAGAADELVAAVAAALDNVDRHAGEGARCWVLVEDIGDAVVVTVRDDGVGMAPERLSEAAAQGRLGVAQSVRGRVADLGGSTAVVSAPGQGTELEMTVPRRRPA